MRKLSYLCFFCLVFLACKKTETPKPQDPQDPSDTTNPGNGKIQVTGISPAHIYTGDTITITGNGFSSDPSRDTVSLGYLVSNKFTLVAITGTPVNNDHNKLKVISASATQLKVATDSAMYMDNVVSYLGITEPTMAVKVAVGNDHVQTDTIVHFRRWPTIWEYTAKHDYPNNNPAGCGYVVTYTYTNDSLFLSGVGMYLPCKFYIDDKEVPMEFYDSPEPDRFSQQKARGHLPIDFFGLINPIKCEDTRRLSIKVINADGRRTEGLFPFWPGPASLMASQKWDSAKYHLSSGHIARFNIKGYCLRNDMFMSLSGRDLGNNSTFQKEFHLDGIENYPSEFTVLLDLNGLPVPSSKYGYEYHYNIKIGGDGIYYGFYSDAFTLFN